MDEAMACLTPVLDVFIASTNDLGNARQAVEEVIRA
jgi:hypothetical protein